MQVTGRVIAAVSGFYDVLVNASILRCTARAGLKKAAGRVSSPTVVGDWVEVTQTGPGEGVVEAVKPRRNELGRAREHKPDQVLVANVDQALLVFAADRPKTNFNKVDQLLVAALSQEFTPILCFNKMDLADDAFFQDLELYESLPIEIVRCSAVKGDGLDALAERLHGKTTALWGPSGVGKSTLTNALHPGAGQRTQEVARGTGKGTHTTVTVTLLQIDADTWLIDTPGWRHITPRSVTQEAVETVFAEVARCAAECRFADCRHLSEPDCAVQKALEQGKLRSRRVESYRQFLTGE